MAVQELDIDPDELHIFSFILTPAAQELELGYAPFGLNYDDTSVGFYSIIGSL